MAMDPATLVRTVSSTTKVANAMKNMWDARTKTRATLTEGTALDLVIRAQVDEVFLVLAHLGEAILPLGVFNKDYYLQTLGEVQGSIATCGNELLPMAWAELDAELQYVCTAGFAICACYAPLPVYRGFGACVLGDWDWACPDMAYLEEKARKKAIRTVYGFKQKVDPQPTRSVFLAFDSAIKILQVKPMAFLTKRPLISGFAEQQPRYGPRPKKEVKHDFELLEDWVEQLEKRGHPAAKGTKLTSWGFPFATWTSPYSCHILKSHKDCETILCNQMDPGRLLHAFVCRGNFTLDEGQVLSLPPRSPAETLMCWLEGLPGTSHKIIKWQDLDIEYFERKINKSLRKKIGRYPLPTQFAVRDPEAATRPSLPTSTSSPTVLEHPNTVSPPPYSRSTTEVQERSLQAVAELGPADARELPASSVQSPPRHAQHSASLPLPGATGSAGLKSIHTLRRKLTAPEPATHSSGSTIPNTSQSPGMLASGGQEEQVRSTNIAELHEETAPSELHSIPVPGAIELPTDEAPKAIAPQAGEVSDPMNDPMATERSQFQEDIIGSEIVEEPSQIEAVERVEKSETTKSNEEANKQKLVSSGNVASSNQYFELLNKVANGEISPQALSQMLQGGDLSSSRVELEIGSSIAEPRVANQSSKSSQASAQGLPYPLSPNERKDRDWQERAKNAIGAPYPETPTDQTQASSVVSGSDEPEVPLSLKPGVH